MISIKCVFRICLRFSLLAILQAAFILFTPEIHAQENPDSIFMPVYEHLIPSLDSGQFSNMSDETFTAEEIDSLFENIDFDSTAYTKKSDYWRSEFLKMISKGGGNSQTKQDVDSLKAIRAQHYDDFSGKIIRNIRFQQLDIFGPEISDTSQKPSTWIGKVGNSLHISTQNQVIKNRLLFEEGDIIDPLMLADNERLLRSMSYLEDALILAKDIGPDSVDITVITKDVLPVGMSFEAYDVAYGRVGLWNTNLLGIGHEFYFALTYDYNRSPNYGQLIRYKVPNLANSFISAEAIYQKRWDLELYELNLNRNFFTPNTKYAGGFGLKRVNQNKNITLRDTLLNGRRLNYDYQDLWVGRAIMLNQNLLKNRRTNLTFAFRAYRYEFKSLSEVIADSIYPYNSRTTFLTSVGLSSQGFKKSRLIYGYGKSEDVPYGWMLFLTGGMEAGLSGNRPYLGVSGSWSPSELRVGYLYQRMEYGTYVNNGPEQAQFAYTLKYISPLLNKTGRYNYRLFNTLRYEAGFQRYPYEFLALNDDNSLRGLSSFVLRGDQLASLNLESVCYSPHYILGFRFVYFLFTDMAVINSRNNFLFRNPMYWGFGGGIRIKNENLVFSSIQLRIGYYPSLPEGTNIDYIHLQGISDPKFNKFTLTKPEILKYSSTD